MARRLRVGVIGTGVGIRTHLPGWRATGRADVLAVSGSSAERAAEVAAAHGIPIACATAEELCALPSLDLICVTSPNPLHLEHFRLALASGKHVLVEKPVALDATQLRAFTELPREPGQLVLVNHQLRFNPQLRALRDAIAAGELGEPFSVRIHQQDPGLFPADAPFSWNTDPVCGGVRLAMGSHLVDLLAYLLQGRTVDSVSCVTQAVRPTRRPRGARQDRPAADVAFSALLRVGGTGALLSATAAAAAGVALDVDVLGDRGGAHFDLDTLLSVAEGGRMTPRPASGVSEVEHIGGRSVFRTSFVHYAEAVVAALVDGDSSALGPACSLEDQVPTAHVLDAMAESARTGTTVEPFRATAAT